MGLSSLNAVGQLIYEKDVFHTELVNAQYDGYIDKLKFMDVVGKVLQ